LLLFAVSTAVAADDTLRVPVQVDQSGKQIYFVVDGQSNVPMESAKFCSAHLPMVDPDECASQLSSKVAETRDSQFEAQNLLPGLSFSVRNHEGETIRFVHQEGVNPALEMRAFCAEHFEQVPEGECVEVMLRNAQMALEEATMVTGSGL